jgi:hypothetical protein
MDVHLRESSKQGSRGALDAMGAAGREGMQRQTQLAAAQMTGVKIRSLHCIPCCVIAVLCDGVSR